MAAVQVASKTEALRAVVEAARRSAVLKDAATREQVHIIQEHLTKLGEDFGRFRTRMDSLARHIDQAHRDVEEVHISASKISTRFDKIERLEIDGNAAALPEAEVEEPES